MSDYRIIVGDCVDRLPDITGQRVAAVITDPPYNVGYKYSSDADGDRRDDYAAWCARWFGEVMRLSPKSVVLSCGGNNLGVWASMSPSPDWWLAWWKPAAMGRCQVGFCNWEPMPFWGKVSSLGCDVVRACVKPIDGLDWHPCPKPIDWAVKLVEMMSKPGELVVDPFCGSGTVGVACAMTGRDFIGIERDPTYAKKALARIDNAASRCSTELKAAS